MSEEQKETIVERVKKLLRLSKGTNSESEAENALAKAKELCAANGIRFESVDAESPQIKEVWVLKDKRSSVSKQWIYGILDSHFGITVVFGKYGVYFVGPEENVEIGKFLLTYLLACERRAWNAFVKSYCKTFNEKGVKQFNVRVIRKALTTYKKDFIVGFYAKIYARLEQQPLRNDKVKGAVKRFLDEKYGEMKKKKTSKCDRKDDSGFFLSQGADAGKSVSLSRPIEGTAMETAMLT